MTSYDIWYIFFLEMSNLFPTISWFVEQCRYRIMTQQNVPRIQSVQQNKNLCIIRKVFSWRRKAAYMRVEKILQIVATRPIGNRSKFFQWNQCQENIFSSTNDHHDHKYQVLFICIYEQKRKKGEACLCYFPPTETVLCKFICVLC